MVSASSSSFCVIQYDCASNTEDSAKNQVLFIGVVGGAGIVEVQEMHRSEEIGGPYIKKAAG